MTSNIILILVEDKGMSWDDMRWLRTLAEGWSRWWCQSEADALIKAKVSNGLDFSWMVRHSYTPSLELLVKSVVPIRRSFTKKEQGKNSIKTLLVKQNWETEIRLRFIEGIQRTSCKRNEWGMLAFFLIMCGHI